MLSQINDAIVLQVTLAGQGCSSIDCSWKLQSAKQPWEHQLLGLFPLGSSAAQPGSAPRIEAPGPGDGAEPGMGEGECVCPYSLQGRNIRMEWELH